MKNLIFILLLTIITFSCTNKKGAEKALRDAGYHPISIGGHGWFCCGEKDQYSTRFKAYSPDRTRIVTGCVCQGLLKGKTIRLD